MGKWPRANCLGSSTPSTRTPTTRRRVAKPASPSSDGARQEAAFAAGAITFIVRALRAHLEEPGPCSKLFTALMRLSVGCTAIKKAIVEGEAAPLLVEMEQSHPSAAIRRRAQATLRHLEV